MVLNPKVPSFLNLGKHLVDFAISSISFLELILLFIVNPNFQSCETLLPSRYLWANFASSYSSLFIASCPISLLTKS